MTIFDKIKDNLFKKFKKEMSIQIKKELENMDNFETMQFIVDNENLLKKLSKDCYYMNRLNICFCYFKSHSTFLDGETVTEINPYIEEMLRNCTIEYLTEAIKSAKEKLKSEL